MTTECSCPIMRSSWRHRPMRDTGDPAAVRRLPAGRGVVPLLAVPEDRGVPPEPTPHLGSLTWLSAVDRPDLVAAPVVAALPQLGGVAWVAEIDDDLADTATFSDAYGVPLEASANCVVVAARRAGQTSLAACVVLATTRADVNGLSGAISTPARPPSLPRTWRSPSRAWPSVASPHWGCRRAGRCSWMRRSR